ncbi:MAG: tyrosine-type recombinase/integrase [Chloroflexi bacterium]|nr:tyrosine-type recombinase/integrase [Chloroflexota bacterium]
MLADIERFVNWVRRRSPEARTWQDYKYDLNLFARTMGERPLSEITFRDIDRFVSVQAERGFKPTTINRRLAAVISLYTFLSDEDTDLVCPVISHRHAIREPQRLPRPVQEDDQRKFFAVIENARDRAMFILMLRCGLRISEVASLKLVDLYLDEQYPRLVAHGKGSHERSVYLSSQAEHNLNSYLAERPAVASDFVFLSYQLKGLSTTSIHKRLVIYRKIAGIQVTAHRFRHSFATDLLNADAAVTSIQKLMGHRWLETTQIYLLANDKQVRQDYYTACQKLDSWRTPEELLFPWGILSPTGTISDKGAI